MTETYTPRVWHSRDIADFPDFNRIEQGIAAAPSGAQLAAIIPNNGARAVGQGELVINAADYGAAGDGVIDDTAAIQNAINVVVGNGGKVALTGTNKTYIISQITLPYTASLEIPAGVILRRAVGNAQTGPMIIADRNHHQLQGKGVIECLNDCPNGIVRVERTDGTCEWGRISDIHIKGPGKTVAGSTALVFSGVTTFQNGLRGVVISDVDTGIRHEGGANMNRCTDVDFYNIGTKVYDFNGTLESSVIGGSVSASAGVTVFTMRSAVTKMVIDDFIAEPGGSSSFWNISTDCTQIKFGHCVDNCASRGPYPVTGVSWNLDTDSNFAGTVSIGGTPIFAPKIVTKSADEIVTNTITYQDDDQLTQAVVAGATYDVEAFIIYDATATADGKFTFSAPGGATFNWVCSAAASGLAGGSTTGSGTYTALTVTSGQAAGGANNGGPALPLVARVKGTLVTTTSAGNLTLRWAQAVAEASNMTVHAGSTLTLRRIS